MLVYEFYGCILVYSAFCALIVLVLYSLSYLVSPKLFTTQKLSAYECGFEPMNSSFVKFHIKYYLTALLFIIFDLEIIFLFPWSLNLMGTAVLGYYIMIIFCFILTIGFIFEYFVGGLEW